MDEMEMLIKKLGLAEKESRVFVNLYESGPETVREISGQAGVTRTHIYIILKKLKKLGLVFEVKEARTSVYKALDYAGLAAYVAKITSDWQSLQRQITDKFGLMRLFSGYGSDISLKTIGEKDILNCLKKIKADSQKGENKLVAVNIKKNNNFNKFFSSIAGGRHLSTKKLNGSLVVWPDGVLFISGKAGCRLASKAAAQLFFAWADGIKSGP